MLTDDQTSDAGSATQTRRTEFGRHLRQLRLQRGLTLTGMADLTGLAISTISKVERGLMSLTYDRLLQVANGLGMDLPVLFGTKGERFHKGTLAVARLGEFQVQETGTYRYELLFPETWNKAMTPITGTVRARNPDEFDDFIRHPGQEFVHVLSGRLTIHAEGRDPVTLAAGESAYLDSGMGHVYTSAGPEDARIVVVCLPDPRGSRPAT